MTFVIRRTSQLVPLLFVVSVLVFLLIHAVPGGPLQLYLENPNVRPEDIERVGRVLGLDRKLGEPRMPFSGSSRVWVQVSGECAFDFQGEVGIVAEAVRHPLDHLDLVVDSFESAGVDGVAGMVDDARCMAPEVFREGAEDRDRTFVG
jgi:hypothetical protein